MTTEGDIIIAILPFEHLQMYTGYKRIGMLLKLGAQCECCLKVAKHFVVVRRSGHDTFALYTEDWVELTVDHVKPKSRGGANSLSNYQVLCRHCNFIRGCSGMSVEELQYMIKSMYKSVVEK